MPKEFI